MTRRELFLTVSAARLAHSRSQAPLVVPVHIVLDGLAKGQPAQIHGFWSRMWPEAVRDFRSGGMRLESSVSPGEVRRTAGGQPVFSGLAAGAINLVITAQIPLAWDNGRGLSGVTTRYDGHDLCLIALNNAHCHQVPLLSVNTCVHELLHVLLYDVYERRPQGLPGEAREFRIDWYATRLWLFHDGAAIRRAAQAYVDRLRS